MKPQEGVEARRRSGLRRGGRVKASSEVQPGAKPRAEVPRQGGRGDKAGSRIQGRGLGEAGGLVSRGYRYTIRFAILGTGMTVLW